MMKSHLILAFALLLVCTGAVLAETPDGETPAEEMVCDNESGAAFGLCNAYCEAMDCESDDPQASETACGKVRDKFTQMTGRDLPCEVPQVTCPCNDPAVNPIFAEVVAGQRAVGRCSVDNGGITAQYGFGRPDQAAYSWLIDGQWRCGAGSLAVFLTITPEEGQYCAQLLEEAANSQGLTCN